MTDEIELLRIVSELIPEPTTEAWARATAAIAAAKEADLAHQDTERYTADRLVPTGLSRRTARRRGGAPRRTMAVASAALAAAAVAAAAVALPGTSHHSGVPGPGQSSGPPAVDTAYLVHRVDGALSAAEPAEIARMTVTTSTVLGTSTAEEWSYGKRWRVMFSRAGKPVFDVGVGSSSVLTMVFYSSQTWLRKRGQVSPAAPKQHGCERVTTALSMLFFPGMPGADASPATVVSLLRTAISCGTLTVAGHQRVDGIDAIKLTSSRRSPVAETIWVDPATYLPVRLVVCHTASAPVYQRTANISWLHPTARNKAELTVPIPAGFRQVRFGTAVIQGSR
jgi:hypothetical protein